MIRSLERELDRLGAKALVALGASGSEADLAAFAGGAKLGEAIVVAARGAAPRLAYLTPMERDEAAATGLELLMPEQLDLARLARDAPEPSEYLAAVLAAALQRSGLAPGRIAIAGAWPAGPLVGACQRLAGDGWSFVSGNEAMRRVRRTKRPGELAEIRRVTAAVGEALRAIAGALAAATERDGRLELGGEPLTVARLKREANRCFAEHELSQPRGSIVAPGEEGAVPHTAGTPERVVRAGESLIVDLFPKGALYADATRTFCVGPPPEPLARAHADVRAALLDARARALPGRRGWDLQEAACRLLGERGWPTPIGEPGTLRGYVHGLGHGVGRELHEYPTFRREAAEEGVLAEGDVVTLEPGLYEPGPGGFGVRLEDLLLVREGGPELLTPWPLELDPRAFVRA